jgi:TPR repeat protein
MDNLYELIKKADSGNVEAQFDVAWYTVWDNESEPIEPDWLERAVDYYERAAAQGKLGVYYAKGEIVEQDYEMAFTRFAKCALLKINACYGSLANLARRRKAERRRENES